MAKTMPYSIPIIWMGNCILNMSRTMAIMRISRMMTYLLPGNSSMAWNLVSGCDFGDFVNYICLLFDHSDDNMIKGTRGNQGLPALA